MDEKKRIQQIMNGETAAFAYFVETYKDMAVTIAFRICRSKAEAEDIAQMAFIKAFRNLHTFQRSSKFSTWFYSIVYNTGISEARKAIHKTEFVDYQHEGLDQRFSHFDTLDTIAQKERKEMINGALARIPETEAVALSLYYLEENSISEVAAIMSLTPVNVKVKLHRGRKNLAKAIQDMHKE